MITLLRVSKAYGAVPVLRGVDLEVVPGRITALVGPNGSGKTTLVKTILGLVRADAGRIRFDGEPIDPDGAYRERIGYMPQLARFPEHLTANEVFAMLRSLRSLTADQTDESLVGQFGLSDALDRPLGTLSGGTRQKVNAAIAFLFDPDLLVLDEPTAGLDPVSSGVLKDAIVAARDDGRTVIVSSHVMSELEEIADDVAFLLEGRTRFHGPVHDLKVNTRQFTIERAIAEMIRRGWAA